DGSLVSWYSGGVTFYPKSSDYEYFTANSVSGRDFNGRKAFRFLFAPAGATYNTSDIARFKYHVGKGVEPYAFDWDGTENKLINDSKYGCNVNSQTNLYYCTQLIRANGWKIPDDYPLKF
ncbi:hypothetical protein IJ732_01125, partial [bacterium]|nr:hypothetical protein [bacterium]